MSGETKLHRSEWRAAFIVVAIALLYTLPVSLAMLRQQSSVRGQIALAQVAFFEHLLGD